MTTPFTFPSYIKKKRAKTVIPIITLNLLTNEEVTSMFHESSKMQRRVVCLTFIDVSENRSDLKFRIVGSSETSINFYSQHGFVLQMQKAMPRLRRLAVGLSLRRPTFNLSPVNHVGFVEDKVTRTSYRVLRFSHVSHSTIIYILLFM